MSKRKNKLNEFEEIPVEEDISLLKQKPEERSSGAKVRVYIAVLLILAILGIGSFFAIQNKNNPNNTIHITASSSVIPVASQSTTVIPASTTTIQPTVTPVASTAHTPDTTITSDKKYYIKMGIYDRGTAETKAQALKTKGYDIDLVRVSGSTKSVTKTEYRVSITYNSKSEAESDKKILVEKGYKSAQVISNGGKYIVRVNSYETKAKAESINTTLHKLGYNSAIYPNTTTSSQSSEKVEMRAVGYTKADGYEAMLRLKNAGYKNLTLFEASK